MTVKATPPVAVVGANVMGLQISDWVQYATLVYVVIMACHHLWKWHREWKAAKKEDGNE